MEALMASFRFWVASTALSSWVRDNGLWVWPASESIHFFGLSLLIGTVGLFDLRMLGMAKGLSLPALHRLIKWGISGYVLNLLTGILFFAATPDQYMYNDAFRLKLVFMACAGINVLVFYTTVFHRIKILEPGDDAPASAKMIAAVSLVCWVGVMSCGRLLTFFRP
jgi:hypothetical protein